MSKRNAKKEDLEAGGSKSKQKRLTEKEVEARFSKDETLNLITIWGDAEIQEMFKTTTRHSLIWETIAQAHNENGYNRTYKQLKAKIASLKTEYGNKKCRSGDAPSSWPFYSAMHQVLSTKECHNDYNLIDTMDIEEEEVENSEVDEKNEEDMLDKKIKESQNKKMTIHKIARTPRRVSDEKKGNSLHAAITRIQ